MSRPNVGKETSSDRSGGSEDHWSGASRFKEGTEASSSEDRILHQPVHSWKRYAILLRTHVSRNAAGKGRAILEGVGLRHERIEMCYRNHPLDEEGAVHAGLQEWATSAPTTDPPTWKVLLDAMDYARIDCQHIASLKAELLSKTVSEGSQQEPQGKAQSDPHGASPSSSDEAVTPLEGTDVSATDELEAKVKDLEQKVADLSMDIMALKTKLEASRKVEKQQQEEITSLKERLVQALRTQSSVSELEAKVKDLERKVADLFMDNMALKTKLEASRMEEKLQQEEITLLKEQALRTQETATQEQSLSKTRESQLVDKIKLLEEERSDLEAEVKQLKKQMMQLEILPSDTDQLTKSFRANLSCYYSKECIQGNPLLDSSTMQHVKLNLVQPKQRQPVAERANQAMAVHLAMGGIERVPHEKVPLDYKNILSFTPPSGILQKRVLIEGVAGSGKSTLVQRMCHDWSVGQFAHDYELVIQVNLRSLPKDPKLSLEDLICTSVEDEDIVKEMVQFITSHKGREVLFIFDGYDEMSKEMQENSLVHSILNGRLAPLSSFVVTSRPISAVGLYCCVDRRVEICGFGEEEVKDYITKYFASSKPSAGKELLSTLSFRHLIAELCYIPLLLLIICYTVAVGGNSAELPRTLHALFEKLIILTVNHNLERAGREERANSLQDVSRFCPSFNKLAQLALEGIEKDTIIFSDLKFEVDKALHGVFNSIAARNQNGIITWHFLHLTLQEFMAAFAVAMKTPGDQVTFWKQHLILKYNKEGHFVLADDHYRTVFLFYCGLSTLSIPAIQRMLRGTIDGSTCMKPTISQGTALPEMCEAIAESGNEHLARSILSSCGTAVEIDGHYLNISVAWCISQYFKQIDGAGIRVRGEEAARGDNAISIPMSALARFVTQQKDVSTLTRVEMKDLQFDDHITDLQTVRQYLLQQAQLKCFTFEVKGNGAKHSTDSKDLVDTKDAIKTADVIDASKDVLTHHRESLEELALGFREDATSDHLNPLMMSLATCERLTSLKLKHVTLSSENLVDVVKALPNLTALKLKSVYLSDENKTTTSVISSSVKEHPSLKEMTVEMPRAQCSESLVIGAVQGMAARRGMEKLALVLYPTLYTNTSLVLLIQQVLRAESLKKLRLGVELNRFQPEVPAEDPATCLSLIIVLLLPQLKYCTELRELKVVVKDTEQMWSSTNVSLLPPAIEEDIPKSTKLQKLTVRGTVNWKVLAPVTAAFLNVATRIKALEEVTLKWCAFGGIDESVLGFADHMKNSQLRRVEMSYCKSLLPFHIATICRSLQQLNTLEELTVSSDSMMKQEDTVEMVEDVSNPEVLQSVEDAVTMNTSVTVIRIRCTELRWTNIAAAILKGTLNNVSLRELELATPENFPPTLPVIVEDVRRAKPMLHLVVRAGYNHYL